MRASKVDHARSLSSLAGRERESVVDVVVVAVLSRVQMKRRRCEKSKGAACFCAQNRASERTIDRQLVNQWSKKKTKRDSY